MGEKEYLEPDPKYEKEEKMGEYAENGTGLNMTEKDLKEMEELNRQHQDEKPPYEITHAFFIAGVQHHQMNEVLDVLGVGVELMIVPEPTNQYDPNAVRLELHSEEALIEGKVLKTQTMLGYVPKKFSSEVVAKLAAGRKLECTIVGFYPAAKSWERCYVEIRQLKE
jgi:hypothetical protein